ncbi:hypothetical protein JKG47_02045 [Acidithiobacillus sp. MC6.1]|nr:hypothetical protein [Acidithiobacillus sp. MC6.1]
MTGYSAHPRTLHEQHLLDSDRCLREVTRLILARTPLSRWPEPLRLPLERAISAASSENRISAYRADALRLYLARIGLLNENGHAMSTIPEDTTMDSTAMEYAKDRLLADLLPAIARKNAHERRA